MAWNEELDGIAVIGMAGRFPGAAGVGELWHALLAGHEGIARFEPETLRRNGVPAQLSAHPDYVPAAGALDGIDRFDADFFGFSPREAEILDPQHRLFLECAWHALEDAALDNTRFAGRVGVWAGAGLNAYLLLHVHPNRELLEAVGAYAAVLATDEDFLTTRTSYKLGLEGPSVAVQTACSSSLVAVSMACTSLMSGECDAALAGGVNVRLPHRAGYLYQSEGILSPDGRCRPYDAEARGTVPASGVGIVVLKRLADAIADGDPVRAVIRGWAVNNDGGAKAGFTTPRAEGQEAVILEAQALAGISADEIGYVEGHGTATPIGDPIEVAALTRAFRAHTERRGYCALGSLKGNLGHLDGAAGVAGLIKATLAVERGAIPGTLHFERPNPRLELASSPFAVHAETRRWEGEVPRRAGVSSFGIGGTNAHLVLEQAPPGAPSETATEVAADRPELFVLSARAGEALDAQRSALAVHLRALGDASADDASADDDRAAHGDLYAASLGDVAHTLRLGRRQLPHRHALVASTAAGAGGLAAALDAGRGARAAVDASAAPPGVAFLFPGQGVQYPGMGAGLYRRYPVYRRALERCAAHLEPELGVDLLAVLFPAAGRERRAAAELRRTAIAQPALFAAGWAASELWRDWGIEPEAMLGHSVGELLAATLAGVFEWRDALSLVAERGRLIDAAPPGAMLSVALAEPRLEELLATHSELSLAAVNAADSCTVGGPPAAVEALAGELEAAGVAVRRLHVERAFHTPALEPLLPAFAERVAATPRRPPRRAFISSLTGSWISAYEATDPEHWARQLRDPVRFADAAATLLAADPTRLLLDLGPGDAMATLLRRHPQVADPARVLAAARHAQDPRDDAEPLLDAAGRLWAAGAPLRLEATAGEPASGRKVRLPLYPFQRRSFWVEATTPATAPSAGKRADRESWFYAPLWKQAPARPAAPGGAAASRDEAEGAAETAPARWIVLAGEEQAPALAARLGARREAAPASRDEAEALLAALRDDGPLPSHWLLAPSAGRAIETLLALVHALARGVHAETLHLVVLSRAAHGVLGDEGAGDGAYEAAAIAGLLRSVQQEHPNLRCRSIDLPAGAGAAEAAALAELGVAEEEPPALVARRGAHRWLPVLEPYPLAAPAGAAPLPAGLHVLITGALGRFGRLAAERLAAHGARLTLLDRRPPRRDEAEAIARLGDALLVEADLEAGADEVAAALDRGRERFGEIGAVLHAAGFDGGDGTPYATVAETGADFYRAHRDPKLGGLLTLDRLLGERPAPRLALVPTSLAPILGGIGLAATAAADAAVDAFCELGAGRLPWASVNFEGWESPLDDGGGLGVAQSALTLDEEELGDVLERLLPALVDGGPRRLAVATGDLETRLRQWGRAGRAGAPGGAAARSEHQAPYRAPASATERAVAAIWEEVLGVETVGLDDDFFMLGGSSLVGLQVISRLRAELDVELPLRSFFEARTAEALAAEIDAERAQDDAEAARLAELLAEIEEMSADDVAELLAEEGS